MKYLTKNEVFEFVPLRSLSARRFIGPELSTHTISFKVSPQHECDALQEKERERLNFYRLVIYMNTLFMFAPLLSTNQATVPSPDPKSRRDWGAKEGTLFFIWNYRKKHLGLTPFSSFPCFTIIIHFVTLNRNPCSYHVRLYLIQSSPHCCVASSQPRSHVHHT